MKKPKITLKKISQSKNLKKPKPLNKRELARENFPVTYTIFLKRKALIDDTDLKKLLQRFSIRYRLAKCFDSLKFKDNKLLGRTYFAGYDVGMKIFLTCSAYELIYKAGKILKIDEVKSQENMILASNKLCARLKANEVLLNLILEFSNSRTDIKEASLVSKGIQRFKMGFNDILPIAIGIRNLFAHGVFTPTGANITPDTIQDLYEIDSAVLKHADKLFRLCTKIINESK